MMTDCVFKGKSGDKVGFFPANFVQRVRPGERVWRVVQGLPGNRERGHMAVKESQVSKYYILFSCFLHLIYAYTLPLP